MPVVLLYFSHLEKCIILNPDFCSVKQVAHNIFVWRFHVLYFLEVNDGCVILTEFHEWKHTVEKETKSSYVALKGACKRLDGYSQSFFCNRSGYARLVADDKRQRAPRTQG